jgi:hypothetical protein
MLARTTDVSGAAAEIQKNMGFLLLWNSQHIKILI